MPNTIRKLTVKLILKHKCSMGSFFMVNSFNAKNKMEYSSYLISLLLKYECLGSIFCLFKKWSHWEFTYIRYIFYHFALEVSIQFSFLFLFICPLRLEFSWSKFLLRIYDYVGWGVFSFYLHTVSDWILHFVKRNENCIG